MDRLETPHVLHPDKKSFYLYSSMDRLETIHLQTQY